MGHGTSATRLRNGSAPQPTLGIPPRFSCPFSASRLRPPPVPGTASHLGPPPVPGSLSQFLTSLASFTDTFRPRCEYLRQFTLENAMAPRFLTNLSGSEGPKDVDFQSEENPNGVFELKTQIVFLRPGENLPRFWVPVGSLFPDDSGPVRVVGRNRVRSGQIVDKIRGQIFPLFQMVREGLSLLHGSRLP